MIRPQAQRRQVNAPPTTHGNIWRRKKTLPVRPAIWMWPLHYNRNFTKFL